MSTEHEQMLGIERLSALAARAAECFDPTNTEPRDTCAACGDGECGGACPAAMEIVRQVIEALGCGEDDWEWWLDEFEMTAGGAS